MKKLLLLLGVVAAAFMLWQGGSDYLSFQYLQQWVEVNRPVAAAMFFLGYVLVTALSLPGAAIMTLMAGALFGLGWGVLLVSFASSIGATLACLVSRTLLRDWVQQRFAEQLQGINRGLEKDGAGYLFTLRLIPLVPFFVINLAFGLTPVRLWTFYWVSQIGMLAATVVYVNAGVQLGTIDSLSVSGILTPGIIGALVLLALFPWVAKLLQGFWTNKKRYRNFQKPQQFDTNLLVIGAGSAGLVSAYIAAATKAKVTLIEKHRMGGDCLNTGCVPSKALIKSAAVAHQLQHSKDYGIDGGAVQVDFSAVMQRVHKVIEDIEPHDSIERYSSLGVDCVQGEAKLISPWQVEVTGADGVQTLAAKNIIVATGARPFVPPISGLNSIDYLTSDNLWQLQQLPQKLLVMGGGPIGCELAQAFARLGSQVTQVDMAERLLPREDEDVSEHIQQQFKREGIELKLGAAIVEFSRGNNQNKATLDSGESIIFDQVLVAVGRQANVDGFGLQELGVELTERNSIATDDYLRTNYPNIYACGDVVGPYQFTHMAAHQAWYACVNALFGWLKKFRVDYSVVPWATFTSPEVARVGINETDARAQNIDFDITRYGIDDLDRAIADGSNQGFVKVITAKGSDKILGATIVGERASDLIGEFIGAMKHGIGFNKILGTIHIYPTMSEANKYAAGEWKRANAPERLLRWVERVHRWRL